jgi:hypothetical protein
MPIFDKNRKGIEFSIDTEWKRRLFITGEVGYDNVTLNNDKVNYASNGIYARIGYDKNILKHDDPKARDVFAIGFRYGMAVIHEDMKSFTISDEYWGNVSESLSAKTMQAHWLEMLPSIKTHLFNNMFLGFSARLRFMVYAGKNTNYPYVYPGYGNGEKKFNVGFNYSLYYQIPLMKVKAKKKESDGKQ